MILKRGQAAIYSGVVALFKTVEGKLQSPRLRFSAPACVLYPAPLNSRNPGAIYIKSSCGQYWGKISPQGQLIADQDAPANLAPFLEKFAKDPAQVAANHGHEHGHCCFCGRVLTDQRSLNVGYGPDCASNYGLPWGQGSTSTSTQPQTAQTAAPVMPVVQDAPVESAALAQFDEADLLDQVAGIYWQLESLCAVGTNLEPVAVQTRYEYLVERLNKVAGKLGYLPADDFFTSTSEALAHEI